MDLYTSTAYQLARQLTERYSTSFSASSRLFTPPLRRHIYAIYGLVRIADEIVDTYKGTDAAQHLDALERSTYDALHSSYSTNPLIHAFAATARAYGIDQALIAPFFESMRIDLSPQTYTPELYEQYIFGSAEVVGLMCLKVFVDGDDAAYRRLEPGAKALGSAYQKVNFLRDCASDFHELGRLYFPGVDFATFSEEQKKAIVADIRSDFAEARTAIQALPVSCKKAVTLSYTYYLALLDRLERTSVKDLTSRRIRVSNIQKTFLYICVKAGASTV